MSSADPTKFKITKQFNRPGICFGIARFPATSRLFYGCSDARVYEVDPILEQPASNELEGHESYVTGVAIAGNVLVSGGYDGRLIFWNALTREKIRTVEAHAKWIRGVSASPDGRLVASVSDDMLCKIWNAETGELVHVLAGHELLTPHHYPSMLFTSAFSPDGRLIATADKVGHVVVWEVSSGAKLASVETPLMYTWDPKQRRHSIGGVRSLAFSPDGKLLAVGGTGQIGNIDHLEALARIEIFDWQENKRTLEDPGDKFKGLVECMQFHPSGAWLIAAGGDHEGFIKFIDMSTNKVLHQDKMPMHVHGFVLNETGDGLFASGHGKLVVGEFRAEPPAPAAAPAENKAAG